MTEDNTITKKEIISAYMEEVLNTSEYPNNIYSFCKKNDLDESHFYEHFNSFEAVKGAVYGQFVTETVRLITASEEYESFSTSDKLLSFYYTFFELLTANRSYVLFTLVEGKNKMESLKLLNDLRGEFKKFIATLPLESIKIPQQFLDKAKDQLVGEVATMQLLFTLKFWIDDTSKGFSKTDSLIEKSVKASFDILHSFPTESILDLGKFLFHEKTGR